MKKVYLIPALALGFLTACQKEKVQNLASSTEKDCGCSEESNNVLSPEGVLKKGYLYGDKEITYKERDGEKIIFGDVIATKIITQEKQPFNFGQYAAWTAGNNWPNATVYYTINPSVNYKTAIIKAAMSKWKAIGITFVPRTSEWDYVEFTTSSGCGSSVGCVGGQQLIQLAPGCKQAHITHEIGHALGLKHEHQRSDRDQYIDIFWNNIDPSQVSNFGIEYGDNEGTALDFNSVMMYPSIAFSANGKHTMRKKNGAKIIGFGTNLSASDKRAIRTKYGI